MKVLITGGTGFIGSRLALKCLEQGIVVRVLGQENNTAESENRKLIEARGGEVVLASVTDKARVPELLAGIDIVYHLAAAQHEANVPDQRFWDVNITGTKYLLEASVNTGVKRFVYGSTIGVYGVALDGVITERSPLRPDNIYGITKLEAEKLVLAHQGKLPIVIIRISETYGPGDRRLLKLFKAIKKKVFFMIGNGKNMHHLIYIDDLIRGLFLAASSDQAPGKIYLLAGKEAVPTREMVQIIARQLGTTLPRVHVPLFPLWVVATVMEFLLRPLGIQPPLHRRRMDFFKKSFVFTQNDANRELNFVPRYSFEDGVKETISWYTDQGSL